MKSINLANKFRVIYVKFAEIQFHRVHLQLNYAYRYTQKKKKLMRRYCNPWMRY